MITESLRKFGKGLQGLPYLLQGYSHRLDRDKIGLIRRAFTDVRPGARSFADLGGVWKVKAGYTLYTLDHFPIDRGFIIDTNYPPDVAARLDARSNLTRVHDNFGDEDVIKRLNHVDMVYLFDVLLHQVNPDWDRILDLYAGVTDCFVIFNQQYTRGNETIRLLDLPYDEYLALVPRRDDNIYRYVYDNPAVVHPQYKKPMRDIHNVWQWGITDGDLRRKMSELGYEQRYSASFGNFWYLEHFANHAFIFTRG